MSHQPTTAPWYILGAGAIGCLWASYWRQAGFPVVLITSTTRTQNIIELQRNNQKNSVDIEQITIDQLNNSDTKIQRLLVTTKAQHTLSAVSAIKNNIAPDATVMVLQNGMAAKKLPAILPNQTLLTAITSDGAYRVDKMSVVHAGQGETFIGCDQHFLQNLPCDYLNIRCCNDIEERQWQKLGINCAINGLTAIYHCKNGELLNKPKAQRRIKAICDEVLAVAAAMGVDDSLVQLPSQVEQTLKTTAENFSSMYQDIAHQRTTEIEFINGYICELADQHGVSCSENRRIVNEVKQLESTAKKPTKSLN